MEFSCYWSHITDREVKVEWFRVSLNGHRLEFDLDIPISLDPSLLGRVDLTGHVLVYNVAFSLLCTF